MKPPPVIPRPKPTPSPWNRHAAAVLDAARRRDPAATQRAATALITTHGPDVINPVMMAWIDTVIGAQGIPYGQPGALAFLDTDGGPWTENADDVRPAVAWAGRLINARIACDEDSYRALIGAVPAGRDGEYINALLDCCALSINYAIGAPK